MSDVARLSEISGTYDAILCDVWGVIRDGSDLVPAALDALQRFRADGKPVLLLSNSPRRSPSLLSLMDQMGARNHGGPAWDGAVTSGDATFEVLRDFAPGPAYKLGPDFDDPLYAGTGLEFAALDKASFVSCTGLIDYETETVEQYHDLLREAQLRRLPMVCANPDIVVQVGDRLLPCGGALARAYEAMGGQTVYAGKPHPPIYDLAYRRLTELAGHEIPRDRILTIGDGPSTDVLGAQQEDLDCFFIADGILGHSFRAGFQAQAADAVLAAEGVAARWSASALVW